jgi:hypothetical protein
MEALNANINLGRLKGGGPGGGGWLGGCDGGEIGRGREQRAGGRRGCVQTAAAPVLPVMPPSKRPPPTHPPNPPPLRPNPPPPLRSATLPEGQLLKLPATKFTVREREMLIGSGILPPEFFAATKNPFVLGVGAREPGRGRGEQGAAPQQPAGEGGGACWLAHTHAAASAAACRRAPPAPRPQC